MADARIRGESNVGFLLQKENFPCLPEVLDSFWIPSSSSAFHGSNSTCKIGNPNPKNTINVPFLHQTNIIEEDMDEDVYDACLQPQPKKRRLTASQVRVLEKNFEVENKLDPEKKVQLAKELGLQPRQVAIWFQNRRARFKNKQLEKDCDSLRDSFDKLKADYDCLLKENESLKTQVSSLKEKLLKQAKGHENIETLSPIKSRENLCIGLTMDIKQEDASSVRSDMLDSDGSNYTDENHQMDPADGSSHVLEQDPYEEEEEEEAEEENLGKRFLEEEYCCEPPVNSCNAGLFLEDQPVWSWLY